MQHLQLRCETKEAFEQFARDKGYLVQTEDIDGNPIEEYNFDPETTVLILNTPMQQRGPDDSEGQPTYTRIEGYHVDILTSDQNVIDAFQPIHVTPPPATPKLRFAGF